MTTSPDPDPRDAMGGWAYMDILLDEYAKRKELDPTNPDRRHVEITMRGQRERILRLEKR